MPVLADGTRYRSRDRLAWILRANRTYADAVDFRSLQTFARGFAGGSRSGTISASQVSRWETGRTPVTAEVLVRYEEMLGLPPALLSSLAYTLLRYSGSRVGATSLEWAQVPSQDEVYDRLDTLLDLLLSNAQMTGSIWDELSYHLITHPSIFLPRGVWATVTERLLSEVIIAEGIAWFQRFEALSRIMGHPRGEQAAIAACVALANDPTNQVFMEPLSVLDCTRHRDANGHIKSQLINPTNDQALRGALLATVRKVRDHHFDGDDLTYLFDILVQHVSDETSHLSARPLASEILRMMPAEMTSHRSRALERALRDDRVISQVLRSGRIAQTHVTAATVNRVCAAAIGFMPGELPTPGLESVLAALVDEMLHSPISDIRLMAAQTIAATPFRYPVADGLMMELSRPGNGRVACPWNCNPWCLAVRRPSPTPPGRGTAGPAGTPSDRHRERFCVGLCAHGRARPFEVLEASPHGASGCVATRSWPSRRSESRRSYIRPRRGEPPRHPGYDLQRHPLSRRCPQSGNVVARHF